VVNRPTLSSTLPARENIHSYICFSSKQKVTNSIYADVMKDTLIDGYWWLDYIQTDECNSGCPAADAERWTLRPGDLAPVFWL
jgi:hypothetical protein